MQAGGTAGAKSRMRNECGAGGGQCPSLTTAGPPREDAGARQRLTGQAGGGVDPLEQLPDAQLATLVGVARQHELTHLHLRGVPVALAVSHGAAGGLRAGGRLAGRAVREHRRDALGEGGAGGSPHSSLSRLRPSCDLSATGGSREHPGATSPRPQLQEWPPSSSLGSQSPGGSLDATCAQFPLGHQLPVSRTLAEPEGAGGQFSPPFCFWASWLMFCPRLAFVLDRSPSLRREA